MKSLWLKTLCGTLFGIACTGTLSAAVESFESPVVPAGYTASKGGMLTITGERFKSGKQSLLWSWDKGGSSMTMATPGGLAKMAKDRGLALWVYNEKPLDQALYLEFLRDGGSVGGCWYNLNFKGWRPLGAPYEQLYIHKEHFFTNPGYPAMETLRLTVLPPPTQIDGIRLTTEKGEGAGKLYLDLVNFDCGDKLLQDDQQPWVGNAEILKAGNPAKYRYSGHDISQNRPWLPGFVPAEQLTPEELKSMDKIAGHTPKIRYYGSVTISPAADAKILEDCRNTLKIKRSQEGIITGVPLISDPSGWSNIKFNNPPDGVPVRDLFTRLTRAYLFERDSGSKEKAKELLDAYIDLCDHIIDQGFGEGSGNMSSYIIEPATILAMQNELAESGRLRDMINCAFYCGLLISRYEPPFLIKDWEHSGYMPRNTDVFAQYMTLLKLCAILPDPAERAQHLYACKRMFKELFNPALGEPYAWDGTTHHHPMWHIAYCAGVSFRNIDSMSGTVFNLPPEVYDIAKRDLKVLAFGSGPSGCFPPNLPGYTGQPLGMPVLKDGALTLARVTSPENTDGFDPDFASFALWYLDPARDPLAQQIIQKGIKPARPEGHLTLNAASVALHRRDDWLVSIAGQNKFRRSYEANTVYIASAFNHYSRNGSVYVVSSGNPPSPWDSGFSLEGWDSRLQPGATSYLGETEAQLLRRGGSSFSAFGGGTSLDGNGIWGMELIRKNVKIADNMRFYKSAFCFDNRVTVITTGIGRGDTATAEERKLEFATTLWQNAIGSGGETEITGKGRGRFGYNPPKKPAAIDPAEEPCWIDGKKITEFPYTATLSGKQAHYLIDNKRTGYYVPAGNPALEVTRRVQKWTYIGNPYFAKEGVVPPGQFYSRSIDPADYNSTEGNFSAAWFAHGARPDFQECIYTLIPNASPESMEKFTLAMSSNETAPYLVRQKDSKAHALWDRASNTTGYLIFNPQWTAFKDSILLKVNRICAVMVKEYEGRIQISAASTDMDHYPAWGAGRIQLSGNIELTLKGIWKIDEIGIDTPEDCSFRIDGENTVLTIPYQTFLPAKLILVSGNPKP